MGFVNDFNLKKQADELGVKVWQTPGFLFLVMGVVAIAIMTAVFFISKNYDNPEVLVLAESFVAIFVLTIGNIVVNIVKKIAGLNKLKSEFVSVASHQLRTPLSAIRWETELLLTKFKKGLSEKQIENIETINTLTGRMTHLVNDLLDVARIDQKRLILKKDTVDLVEIIEDSIKEAKSLGKIKNIEIEFCAKKKLPKAVCDKERIKMVVDNLLNNSLKYTTNKGHINVHLVKKDNNLVFTIKDSGVGIPEEQHGRVFDKFFRSDNAVKYQTEGTGLGLYITKNIIEQSGGKIWFQSIENIGTIFSFSLPISAKRK